MVDVALTSILIVFCSICFIIGFMCCHLICFSKKSTQLENARRRREFFRRAYANANGGIRVGDHISESNTPSPPPSFSRAFSFRKPLRDPITSAPPKQEEEEEEDAPPTYEDYLRGLSNLGFVPSEDDLKIQTDLLAKFAQEQQSQRIPMRNHNAVIDGDGYV